MKPRVAFVVQRCGVDVNGGAEQLCLAVAERMAAHWTTDIVTTCARDYLSWANHFPEGVERVAGVTIRRFPVAVPRTMKVFNLLSRGIEARLGRLSRDQEEGWMRLQGPNAPSLFAYLERHRRDYDAFVFFTYLYATTYFGLPLVADRAVLVPTAHDEWMIKLAMWDAFFERPRGFVFNSVEERDFLARRFPRSRLGGPIAGVAVDPPDTVSPERFRRRTGIDGPIVLYMGRLDISKGVKQLVEMFQAFQAERGQNKAQLVLMGRSVMKIPSVRNVHEVGFVDVQTKWDAIAASSVVVMPSPFESLSIAVLEAWSMGKPVLVNGRCEVLVGQCRRSEGGLWYEGQSDFFSALDRLISDPQTATRLGQRGRDFAAATYSWKKIVGAYREVVGL